MAQRSRNATAKGTGVPWRLRPRLGSWSGQVGQDYAARNVGPLQEILVPYPYVNQVNVFMPDRSIYAAMERRSQLRSQWQPGA